MGWASGSPLAEEVWESVRKYIPEKDREIVAGKVVNAFMDMDCDTIEEAETLWADANLLLCYECGQYVLSEDVDNESCKDCKNKI